MYKKLPLDQRNEYRLKASVGGTFWRQRTPQGHWRRLAPDNVEDQVTLQEARGLGEQPSPRSKHNMHN
eukprot:8527574-Prorocentrum_lima.AAC.1